MVCICTEIQKRQCLFKEFTFAVGMPFYRFQSPTLNSDSDLNSWGIYFSLFTVWVTVLPAKSVSIGKMRATGASFLRTTLFGCNILLLTWLAGAGKKSREKHNPEVSDTLCNFPCCCGTHLFAKGYFESLFFAYTGRRSSSSGQREHLGWCVYPVMQTLSCYSGRHCCCPCTCGTCCGSCWGAFREQCVLMVSPHHFPFTPWTCTWESCSSRLRFYFPHVQF